MDKIFDKLPYDFLEGVKFAFYYMAAAGVGVLLIVASYFTVVGAVQKEYTAAKEKKIKTEKTFEDYKRIAFKRNDEFKKLVRVLARMHAVKNQFIL